MTIRNFEIAKLELQNALVSQDLKSYRSSNHRIRMTVELLHAGRLLSTIERGRSLLESNVAAMEEKEEASVAMGEEFNSVISGLKDTLINRWGSVEATNGL